MMDMKRYNQFSIKSALLLFLLLLAAGASVQAAGDENGGYAVLIEQSPMRAGSVNPGLGVHTMDVGSTVTLTAVPKPGYRFLYWLGDVRNPSNMATQVDIDGPKILVAVYEREEFELPLTEMDEGLASGAPRGGGGGRRTPLAFGAGGPINTFFGKVDAPSYTFVFPDQPEEEPENDPFPVPDIPDRDFPVPDENPIPEPMTLCLFTAGSILLRLKRVSGFNRRGM